jgi:hypothetical protein
MSLNVIISGTCKEDADLCFYVTGQELPDNVCGYINSASSDDWQCVLHALINAGHFNLTLRSDSGKTVISVEGEICKILYSKDTLRSIQLESNKCVNAFKLIAEWLTIFD